jgi:hypothetical protein
MGRNSVEAMKACLMRAVRAALAARLARVLLFLPRLVLCLPLFFVPVDLAFPVVLAPGFGVEPAVVWACNGDTAISMASAPASNRIDLDAEFAKSVTLISPLYADFASRVQS